MAYWCDSPNPARAPTVEHVCNTTRRAPASGEERNTRDSIPLARSTRHSPLNSRRSAAVVSLSLSLCPQDALLSLSGTGGQWKRSAERVRAYTVLQSASDPPLCGLECLFLSETRSNRSPTRARVHRYTRSGRR